MGFPTPAMNYIERQLSSAVLYNISPDGSVLETNLWFVVIEPA